MKDLPINWAKFWIFCITYQYNLFCRLEAKDNETMKEFFKNCMQRLKRIKAIFFNKWANEWNDQIVVVKVKPTIFKFLYVHI